MNIFYSQHTMRHHSNNILHTQKRESTQKCLHHTAAAVVAVYVYSKNLPTLQRNTKRATLVVESFDWWTQNWSSPTPSSLPSPANTQHCTCHNKETIHAVFNDRSVLCPQKSDVQVLLTITFDTYAWIILIIFGRVSNQKLPYFPLLLNSVSTLPGKTGNPEITSFHLNPAYSFANRHKMH